MAAFKILANTAEVICVAQAECSSGGTIDLSDSTLLAIDPTTLTLSNIINDAVDDLSYLDVFTFK